MFFHVAPEKCHKIKALLLLAILSVSEGRRVSSNIFADKHFASSGSVQHVDSAALGRYSDGPKYTTTPTAAARALHAAMADPTFQNRQKSLAEAMNVMLTAPKFQELAMFAQEHLRAILDDPGFLEQLNLLAEQIKALATEPKIQEWHKFVTEAMEQLPGNLYLQEHAKLALEQLSAIMDDTTLLQQSELFAAQLEGMKTDPKITNQDIRERANVFLEQLTVTLETPELQKHSTLLAKHIKSIMEHPEVQAMHDRAKLASNELKAITEDQDFVKRVELASEQCKWLIEHPVLREHSKLFAQQVEAIMSHSEGKERAAAAASLAEVNRSSSEVSLVPPSLARRAIRAPDPQMFYSKSSNERRGSSRKPKGLRGVGSSVKRAEPAFAAWEKRLLQTVAVPYFATPVGIFQSRPIIENVFGQPSSTFEDLLREPAAGFLALLSPLGPLEGFLCLALASVALTPGDRSRAGAALAGTSAATIGALAFAFASGLQVTNTPALAAAVAVVATTGALGLRALGAVEAPLAMYRADAVGLLPSVGERTPTADELTSLFYRSSTLTGVIVGLSFLFSPLSPIALFDTPESPVTHLARQQLGIYIVFLLAPVQAALFRAAKDGELRAASSRALNVITGLCCLLLVCDGRFQVEEGARALAALQPGSDFYDAVTAALGDPAAVGRAQTNTDAAFFVGFAISLFYLYQARPTLLPLDRRDT